MLSSFTIHVGIWLIVGPCTKIILVLFWGFTAFIVIRRVYHVAVGMSRKIFAELENMKHLVS